MRIALTTHAKTRVSQREITEKEIKSVIGGPDVVKESFKQRMLARKRLSRGTLEVIFKESAGEYVIITCYWIKER